MATRTSRLIQDQNLSAHMDDFTGQMKVKVGTGGRKPLGDLSNKGSTNQAGGRKVPKHLKSKKVPVMKDEAVPAKVKNSESKRIASEVSEKLRTGNRKALSDISNSAKLHVGEIKNKNSLKLSALSTESFDLSAIYEESEQRLKNPQECMKSQSEAMDIRQYLKTFGLENGSDDHWAFSSESPTFNKLKPKRFHLELDEIPEPDVEYSWKKQFSLTEHGGSPVPYYTMWEDSDVNFMMIKTPKLSKN